MNQPAVRAQINALAPKYQVASKNLKSEILNSLQIISGRNRKHLIRCLNRAHLEILKNDRDGRPKKYEFEDLKPYILNLWELMGKISPKRMKAAFKDWLPFYKECPASLRMQLAARLARALGHSEALFVKKLLEEQIEEANLKLKIKIEAA